MNGLDGGDTAHDEKALVCHSIRANPLEGVTEWYENATTRAADSDGNGVDQVGRVNVHVLARADRFCGVFVTLQATLSLHCTRKVSVSAVNGGLKDMTN